MVGMDDILQVCNVSRTARPTDDRYFLSELVIASLNI